MARGGYEAVLAERPVDVERALRDALAVYYFPGMWEWDRSIVRPLALDGFARSLRDQVAPGEPEADLVARGSRLLERYFDWARLVDDFTPIRVATDFDVAVPDPASPDRDLATASGDPVRYQGRVDLLVIDGDDNYWVVDHRLVAGSWTDLDQFLLEERVSSYCWAWERFFIGMDVAGVVYVELRDDGEAAAVAPAAGSDRPAGGHRRMYAPPLRVPRGVTVLELRGTFRRTTVPWPAEQRAALRDQFASEALDMVDPGVRVYPNPSPAACGACGFREPCLAVTLGGDAAAVLARAYRKRELEDLVEGRLGGVTWGMGRGAAPPTFRGDSGP